MYFKILLLNTIVILLPLILAAQSIETAYAKNKDLELNKWEVIDVAFKIKKGASGSPFELIFGAEFKGPENETLDIPGFYNGKNEWIIRFSSGMAGKWSFETYSSHSELSGLKGTVAVSANSGPDEHGAVMIDPRAPQHFMYEDSTTYFGLAFELDWLFALDYGNKNGIPKTQQIISNIKNNGFNQVVMNVYAYDVNWPTASDVPDQYEYKEPDFFPFKGTNEAPDFSALNINFFKHFDRVIQHLDEQGIVAHIMIYVWNKNVNWPDMYSVADNMYFDYVIKRYQAFSNIIWDVSKEALDYGRADIPYISERISRIREIDAYESLVTVHDYEYCSRQPELVDFISIQSWRSNLYSLMLQAWDRHANKPVMNIEHGGYEDGPYDSFTGNYTSPETCLIRNYECAFAGVYPSYYWQNTSWNIVIYDPLNEQHNFPAPRFDFYKHMQDLFSKYNYNNLFPTIPKLTTNDRKGLENLSTSGYPLTNGEDLFLFLIPASSDRIHTVLPKPENGKMKVTWFNPFTGEYKEQGTEAWAGWKEFKSPWVNIYNVLIIEMK